MFPSLANPFLFSAGKIFFLSPILRICFIREASNMEMDEVLKVYTENDGYRNTQK